MSIVSPTPADLLDRLSIVAIKVRESRLRGQPYEHFCLEQDEILNKLTQVDTAALISLAMELSRVNKELWDMEERRRNWHSKAHADVKPINAQVAQQWRQDLGDEAGAILESLGLLNAERISLKKQIDQACQAWLGEEKVS